MSGKSQVLRRLVSAAQKLGREHVVPRTGNALVNTTFEGTVSHGGPPKVMVSPSIRLLPVRGYPCASSLGLPPPEKVVLHFNAANTDEFIALADAIEMSRPELVVEGNEAKVAPGTFIVTTEGGDVLEKGTLETITAEKVLQLVEEPAPDASKQAVSGQDCVI